MAGNLPVDQQERNGRCYNPLVMSYIRDDWIRQQMQLREAEYTDHQSLKIFTGTWNVNAKKPMNSQEAQQLKSWLVTSSEQEAPDIFVIGFQEIVDLNAVNVVVNNLSQQRSAQWKETIRNTLKSFGDDCRYQMIMEKHLVGILLLVFAKSTHVPHIRDVQSTSAGVGVMGVLGNKGAVAVRLQLYSSTFCFMCSHLAAHRDNISGRNADYGNILAKTEFHGPSSESGANTAQSHLGMERTRMLGILDHDCVIWLGDLNYRITEDVSIEHCFARLEANDLQYLADHDQLTMERKRGAVFRGFEEGNLNFRPTYKFQPGTSLYERRPEKKTRAPAWCDRILWKCREGHVELKLYDSINCLQLSDHKPVRALFQVQVRYEVEEKRNLVMREIMHQLDKWENENMPKVKIEGSVISFSEVYYCVPVTRSFWVENTGQVVAHFRFIPKLQDKIVSKPWLSVKPAYGMIPPNEKLEVKLQVHVNTESAQKLMNGTDTLDETLILRIENGRDYFVIISGQYQPSCFGTSLEELVHQVKPVRIAEAQAESGGDEPDSPQKIPKELWRIVDDIFHCGGLTQSGIWRAENAVDNIYELQEALDTGAPFPSHSPRTMVQLLLAFLKSFQEPIVPEHLVSNCEVDPMRIQLNGRAVLNGLSAVHYNVFVYLVSFLREVLKHAKENKCSAMELAYLFSPCFISVKSTIASSKEDTMRRLLVHFLTTNAL